MAHEIGMRLIKPLAGPNRKKVDVGDKTVDAGIDAGRAHAVQIAVLGIRSASTRQIRNAARIGLVRHIAADALKMIALRVVFPRLSRPAASIPECCAHEAVAEQREIAIVLQREYDITQ